MLFVLFEHASGYAIFRCEGVEDIGGFLPEVQEAVMDFARFGSMLTLEAFSPFKSGVNALENINCISEGAKLHLKVPTITSICNFLCRADTRGPEGISAQQCSSGKEEEEAEEEAVVCFGCVGPKAWSCHSGDPGDTLHVR